MLRFRITVPGHATYYGLYSSQQAAAQHAAVLYPDAPPAQTIVIRGKPLTATVMEQIAEARATADCLPRISFDQLDEPDMLVPSPVRLACVAAGILIGAPFIAGVLNAWLSR